MNRETFELSPKMRTGDFLRSESWIKLLGGQKSCVDIARKDPRVDRSSGYYDGKS
jgi:hypothetical protein